MDKYKELLKYLLYYNDYYDEITYSEVGEWFSNHIDLIQNLYDDYEQLQKQYFQLLEDNGLDNN